jgi:hypothetical protein
MRKIEQNMLNAIAAFDNNRATPSDGATWQQDNTRVLYWDNGGVPFSSVWLFGNLIGEYWHNTGEFTVSRHTLREWPTPTTISRLRALGANVYRRAGRVYLDGEAIN